MSRRPADAEEGAVFVEFALILPILLAALFGILTAGIAWQHNLAINHATRQASRFASTLPQEAVADDAAWVLWLDEVATFVDNTDEGTFSTNGGATMCVAFVDDVSGQAHVRRQTAGAAATYSHVATDECYSDGLAGARVQAELTRTNKLNWFLTKTDIDMRARGTAPHNGTTA